MNPRHLNPLVHDFLVTTSKNLFNAAQSGDREYAQATLTTLYNAIPSYIAAIIEERNENGRQ